MQVDMSASQGQKALHQHHKCGLYLYICSCPHLSIFAHCNFISQSCCMQWIHDLLKLTRIGSFIQREMTRCGVIGSHLPKNAEIRPESVTKCRNGQHYSAKAVFLFDFFYYYYYLHVYTCRSNLLVIRLSPLSKINVQIKSNNIFQYNKQSMHETNWAADIHGHLP